jgi:hypothetical protein
MKDRVLSIALFFDTAILHCLIRSPQLARAKTPPQSNAAGFRESFRFRT